MNQANTIIYKLKQRYQLIRIGETLLLSIAVGLLVSAIAVIFNEQCSVVFTVGASLTFFIRIVQLQLFSINEKTITRFLNQVYTSVQGSADLLIKNENELSILEQVQRERTQQALFKLYPSIKVPHQLSGISLLFLISCTTFVVTNFLSSSTEVSINKNVSPANQQAELEHVHVKVNDHSITISPPPYTQLKVSSTNKWNITIPEGSTVTWSLKLNKDTTPYLVLSSNDTIPLKKKNARYEVSYKFIENNFYQVIWKDSSWISSDYHRIEIITDKEPTITIKDLPQFIEGDHKDLKNIGLTSHISDDYGIAQAYIIATVSKGSGESVKFREEKLAFASPSTISGKSLSATRSLDLLKLGMEPGDELYFYVEAHDNKVPISNKSRTETYFISLRDTAENYITSEGGLGVDLMPEYFRSQRQIIIDTEKLLRNKKSLSNHDFNFTSNELGYDQKVLRLRYGQFLGEEFESGITSQATHDHDEEEEEEDPTKKFGHVHDNNNEHNLVEEKHEEKKDGKNNPLEEFMHMHDDSEVATFFIQSLKAKLKAALTQMWDAELYLRLYEPQKSLPYQYKALQLLKEISNDSRIYVHRTGFDPPPIKEEKRLTGDLNEIRNSSNAYALASDEVFPNIKSALLIAEQHLATANMQLNKLELHTFQLAGNELAQVALAEPVQFLESLSILKSITEQKLNDRELQHALNNLRNTFWKIVPPENTKPTKASTQLHPLDKKFSELLHNREQ